MLSNAGVLTKMMICHHFKKRKRKNQQQMYGAKTVENFLVIVLKIDRKKIHTERLGNLP